MRIKFISFIVLLLTLTCNSSIYSQDIPDGPYFGQKAPGLKPEVFAPHIISMKGRFEYVISFSPDGNECCFGVTNSSWSTCDLYYTKCNDGKWTQPDKAYFQKGFDGWLPFFAPDGERFFFSSSRPKPPAANIWMSEKINSSWSDPQKLGGQVNTAYYEWRPNTTADGTLYFSSGRKGGVGESDIYRAELTDGDYSSVEILKPNVNSSFAEASPSISPDGKYLLIESTRPGGFGQADLYISYLKDDETWTTPQNLGPEINTEQIDDGGCISNNGKYFFFNRRKAWITTVDTDIYWVDSRVVFKPYVNIPIQDSSAKANKEFQYQIPKKTFKDRDDSVLTYTASLSNGNKLPKWLKFNQAAKIFTGKSAKETTLFLRVTAADKTGSRTSDDFLIYIFPDKTK